MRGMPHAKDAKDATCLQRSAGGTGETVERLALRAVAPRRAARGDGLEQASVSIMSPALRGLVCSQRDYSRAPGVPPGRDGWMTSHAWLGHTSARQDAGGTRRPVWSQRDPTHRHVFLCVLRDLGVRQFFSAALFTLLLLPLHAAEPLVWTKVSPLAGSLVSPGARTDY